MNMEEIRNNYENGLMFKVESLASAFSTMEENGWNRITNATVSYIDNLRGYISAGMFAGIITDEEYDELMDEVHRWRYYC